MNIKSNLKSKRVIASVLTLPAIAVPMAVFAGSSADAAPAGRAPHASVKIVHSAEQKAAFNAYVAHATCMRDHGVAEFADPTWSETRRIWNNPLNGGRAIPGGIPFNANGMSEGEAGPDAREECDHLLVSAGLLGTQ